MSEISKGGNNILYLLAYLQVDRDALFDWGVWEHSLLPPPRMWSMWCYVACVDSLKTRHLPLVSLETFSPQEVRPWVEKPVALKLPPWEVHSLLL